MKDLLKWLKDNNACVDGYRWSKQFATPEEWWNGFERGDWMLWVIGKVVGEPESDSRKKLVLCACECARLALPYVKKGEKRPLQAIETAEKWARGDIISLNDVRDAADAANDAAAVAYTAAAAAYAADAADYAAVYAADAANAVAYAADAAAVAYTAAYAAAYAAYALKTETLKKCADIVRKHYRFDEVIKIVAKNGVMNHLVHQSRKGQTGE